MGVVPPAIVVRLHGSLRRFLPPGEERMCLSAQDAGSVGDVVSRLHIPDGEIWTVSVNGQLAQASSSLSPGDQVDVFAPVAGGSF